MGSTAPSRMGRCEPVSGLLRTPFIEFAVTTLIDRSGVWANVVDPNLLFVGLALNCRPFLDVPRSSLVTLQIASKN